MICLFFSNRIKKRNREVFYTNLKSNFYSSFFPPRLFPFRLSNFLSHLNPRDFNIPHCRHHPSAFFCSRPIYRYWSRLAISQSTKCSFASLYYRQMSYESCFSSCLRHQCSPYQVKPWAATTATVAETKTLRREGRRHSIYHQRWWHGEKNKIWYMRGLKSPATYCKRHLWLLPVYKSAGGNRKEHRRVLIIISEFQPVSVHLLR